MGGVVALSVARHLNRASWRRTGVVTMRYSEADLVRMVTKIVNTEGTEAEIDELVQTVNREVPHPEWMALAFHDDRGLTAEQVVKEALAYQPIAR